MTSLASQQHAAPGDTLKRVTLKQAKATCPYCGVGCVVDVKSRDDRFVQITADPATAPNFGMLCPKGALLFKSDNPERRLTTPMMREHKDAPLREASWKEALTFIAGRITAIRDKRGQDRIAFYGSGQLDTEASYLFTKLFKGYLRTNQMDTNSRLCMSSAVAGYVKAFGSDGPPTCYADIESADTFVVLGANMTANHPVLFNRVRRRRATSDTSRIVVIDPRRSKTAEFADLHLPVKPGGDVALLLLVMRRLIELGELDRPFIDQHTEGYADLSALLENCDPRELHRLSGINADQIDAFAGMLAGDRRLLSFYCMGANQSTSGVDKNTAIINVHLMLGEVGKVGSGPFSLTGQPNAMGGREVGYLCHQLPGYRKVTDASHRAQMEEHWGIPAGSIQPTPGRSAVPMFQAAADGEIDVLWIACTNPAVSMPNVSISQAGLKRTGLVIVQDCFADTETAHYADVLLPAATWGEKSGTMTNSERLVTRSRAVKNAPGKAVPDWQIVAAVGRTMGFDGFDYTSPKQVWDELRQTTAGTLCDLSGMTNERLEQGGIHWPCPSEDHPGEPRRYTDQAFPTPTGRARFHAESPKQTDEQADPDYPLGVTTGRVAAQWHTRARTGNVPELVRQAPEPFIEINPLDADTHQIEDGQWVYAIGKRGRALAKARVTDSVGVGTVFLPFHWGDSFHPETTANFVTNDAVDSVSLQPELKFAAVRIEPAPAPTLEGVRS
ncbi:MAG: nitrate reductase [Phycisphaeraceae bacterium]|nr:nitrate reductase [Phycisphaeraceae bacterium]